MLEKVVSNFQRQIEWYVSFSKHVSINLQTKIWSVLIHKETWNVLRQVSLTRYADFFCLKIQYDIGISSFTVEI